jgi:CBS-domain-containing membrane protein
MTPVPPPQWTDEEFENDRRQSIHIFRERRMQEPLEQYLEAFEVSRDAIDTLLESSRLRNIYRAQGIEDLKKAAWYVNREIERQEKDHS